MNSLRKLTLLLFCASTSAVALAGARGGEITYEWLNAFQYRIYADVYEDLASSHDSLEINFGDGSITLIGYYNDTLINGIRHKRYKIDHNFPGPGNYNIEISDPNWHGGIINITNSFNYLFTTSATLIISPVIPIGNSSVKFGSTHFDISWWAGMVTHNCVPINPDGDSLVFSLEEIGPVPTVYQYPQQVGGGSCVANNLGIVQMAVFISGEYALKITIKEYKNGMFMGQVSRQIILPTENNTAIAETNMTSLVCGPNPVQDKLTVYGLTPSTQLKLYTLQGTFLKTIEVYNTMATVSFDNFAAGHYLLCAFNSRGQLVNSSIIVK